MYRLSGPPQAGILHRRILQPFPVPVLRVLDELVKSHGDHAQYDDACDDKMELEYLTAVNDQITESSAGGEKFSDDNAYESQTDIYFHCA